MSELTLNVTNGMRGDSAYVVAVKEGFVGTEAEWLESLKGEPGTPGSSDTPTEVKTKYESNADTNAFTDAEKTKVANAVTDLSDYSTTAETGVLLDTKVDKVTGKGLSENDYTNAEKTKVTNAVQKDGSTPFTEIQKGVDGEAVDDLATVGQLGSTLPSIIETIAKSTNLLPNIGWTQGYYKWGTTGVDTENPIYKYSPNTPVEENTLYTGLIEPYLTRTEIFRFVCFYDEGDNILDGGINSFVNSFTTPENTSYVVVSTYSEVHDVNLTDSSFGIFEGTNPTWEYYSEEYTKVSVDTDNRQYNDDDDIATKLNVDKSIADTKTEVLNIETCDKIIMTGCSYTEGTGNMEGKSWINKLSEYLNINIVNYGTGGHRIVDITDDIRNNRNKYGSNLGIRDLKPFLITIANIGNETISGYNEINSDLYRKELKECLLAIRGIGAEVIMSTDHAVGTHSQDNYFIESLINQFADENNVVSHCIGVLGEQLTNITYGEFYSGSHPGSRMNSYTFIEWLYFLSKINISKSLKIFRPRSSVTVNNIKDLNYDDITQRAKLFREIGVGEGVLNDETLYDRLGSSPSSSIKTDEYLAFLDGESLDFEDYALIDCTINKVCVDSMQIEIKGGEGLSFYLKNNFDPTTYAPTNKTITSVIYQVTKTVFDSITAIEGDAYTDTTISGATLTYTGAYHNPYFGYLLGFDSDITVSLPSEATGDLVRATGSGNSTITFEKCDNSLSRYSFDFISTVHESEGAFNLISADYTNGVYTININTDIYKYLLKDNIKLIAEKAGIFSISDFQLTYVGGKDKEDFNLNFKRKKNLPNNLLSGGFASDWENDWTSSNATREQVDVIYQNYPAINPENYHIRLGFNSDETPDKISRIFNVTASRGRRKMIVRVVAQLFPKIYNTGLIIGDWVTDTQQINPDSYDNDYLCLGLNVINEQETTYRSLVPIGWSECYFEVELPAFNDTFELSLSRDINPNNTWDMMVYDVSVEIE